MATLDDLLPILGYFFRYAVHQFFFVIQGLQEDFLHDKVERRMGNKDSFRIK